MTESIVEYAPLSLCDQLDGYESIIPQMVPQFLGGVDFDTALGYVKGALLNQQYVWEPESKVFKGTIKSVSFVERRNRDSGFLLGRKALIHFTDSRSGDEQDIMTGWTEYNGFNPEEHSFEVAQSNAMVRVAEENIGVECLIRKAFVPAETKSGGNRVRYVAMIIPLGDSKPSKSKKERKRGKDNDADKGGEVTASQLRAAADELDAELDVADLKDLAGILSDIDGKEDVAAEIAEVFGVDEDKVLGFIEEEGDLVDGAIIALDELLD